MIPHPDEIPMYTTPSGKFRRRLTPEQRAERDQRRKERKAERKRKRDQRRKAKR
jgi:Spy/CpxP family protein refolding chaperone